jgi:ribosome-binding protein aMBF1 (putative translation factor)
MAIDQNRKRRTTPLTPEEMQRVEAIRARHRTPQARAQEMHTRELLDQEYRETGTIETTGDGTTMGDMVAFRRFIMSLRQERERRGFSLNEMAERAKIDKAALSRLENGQQLNPTINTLARYVHALGKRIAWSLCDPSGESATSPLVNVERKSS